MKSVTITDNQFKNAFDNVLINNPTIHKILSKESNLGFTIQLVMDQLKVELIESLFTENEDPEEVVTEESSAPVSADPISTEENSAPVSEDPDDELEDLDELNS